VIDQQRSLMSSGKARARRAGRRRRLDRRARRAQARAGLSQGLPVRSDLVDAKIGTLSGGERSRLLLAREFARKSNLLVLDEPTNDLDLETLDLLQEVIADYEGTVLIVSHDRDFLDRTVTSRSASTVRARSTSSQAAMPTGKPSAGIPRRLRPNRSRKRPTAPPPPPPAKAKLSYKDQRDYDLLPMRIEELDAAIARDDSGLWRKNLIPPLHPRPA
jgi:ABC transport system ATP-binding/permease protein